MKIALVHDYLREYGGAERVLEVLHEMYPQAPLYTSFVDWKALGEFAHRFRDWDIRVSPVGNTWLMRKAHSPLRFLTPLVWESIDLREFDFIISSSGWYICRGVITHPGQIHISYIHHPPRNLYGYPTGSSAKQNLLVKTYAALINPFLRIYDYSVAQRVDYLIANSEETRRRIKKFYRRDATVIYPPVDVKNNAPQPPLYKRGRGGVVKMGYFLSVGRLTYAKRVDLAINACNELKLPLKIVGTGKEEHYLRSIAGSTIEFLGAVSDEELDKLYAGAKALIFCALEEDFGMVPVEAMGHGVPAIALRQGGVQETVVEGKTGLFFDQPRVENLISTIKQFLSKGQSAFGGNNVAINPVDCFEQAQKFSKVEFMQNMSSYVDKITAKNESKEAKLKRKRIQNWV